MPSTFVAKGRFQLIVGFCILSTYATAAAAETRSTKSFGSNTTNAIRWGPCLRNLTVPLLCGTLAVPLDYLPATGDNSSSLILNLVKLPSLRQPSNGSILVNPGGPGQGGRNFLATSGTDIQTYASDNFAKWICPLAACHIIPQGLMSNIQSHGR
jgi:hypothetical protein